MKLFLITGLLVSSCSFCMQEHSLAVVGATTGAITGAALFMHETSVRHDFHPGKGRLIAAGAIGGAAGGTLGLLSGELSQKIVSAITVPVAKSTFNLISHYPAEFGVGITLGTIASYFLLNKKE